MTKKALPILLAVVLVFSLAACGNNGSQATPDPAPAPEATPAPEAKPEPEPVTEAKPEPTPVPLSARPGAIDFEDSNYSFMIVDTSPADASKEVEISVADKNGSKMLKIENKADGKPYVAIDASSLLGDNISNMRSMEFTVYTEHPDGNFYASSGTIIGYCGTERTAVETKKWSVFLDNKNPNLGKFEMTKESEYMVPGSHNFFVLTVDADNGEGVTVYIDDICFLDASGNTLPVDTSVKFDAPAGFGQMDTSNLIGVSGEKDLGLSGETAGGWGQAISVDSSKNDGGFDLSLLKEGCVVTVFYTSASVPELILQSWTEGAPDTAGWAKVAPFTVNDSGTIAQFKYDDMVAAFGSGDWEAYMDKFNIGDTGEPIKVSKVTIGTGKPDSPYVQEDRSNLVGVVNEADMGFTGETAGGWGQAVSIDAVKNEGAFDPAVLVEGCVITAYFTSVNPPELILQSWTEGAPETAGWAKVAPFAVNDSNTIAQFSYEDMVLAFGTDDFETFVDKFYIGDTGEALKLLKLTIGAAE